MADMEELINALVDEVRDEFQIPPYFPVAAIKNYVYEGVARLSNLNPGCDLEADKTYRMLLKNYVYYAYHHKVNEWEQNYATLILSWQLGSEVKA